MDASDFENTLREKLVNLELTQGSISDASNFMKQQSQNIQIQRKVFRETLAKFDINKKMSSVYLLNDVIQNTKKSHGDLFSQAFSKLIDRTFRNFAGHAAAVEKMNRVCSIWAERNCFSPDKISSFFAILSGASSETLEEQPLPPLLELQSDSETKKHGLLPVLKSLGESGTNSSLEENRMKLLRDNIVSLMEQTESEQEASVLGREEEDSSKDEDFVTEHIYMNYEKNFDSLEKYEARLKHERKIRKILIKKLKDEAEKQRSSLNADIDLGLQANLDLADRSSNAWDVVCKFEQSINAQSVNGMHPGFAPTANMSYPPVPVDPRFASASSWNGTGGPKRTRVDDRSWVSGAYPNKRQNIGNNAGVAPPPPYGTPPPVAFGRPPFPVGRGPPPPMGRGPPPSMGRGPQRPGGRGRGRQLPAWMTQG